MSCLKMVLYPLFVMAFILLAVYSVDSIEFDTMLMRLPECSLYFVYLFHRDLTGDRNYCGVSPPPCRNQSTRMAYCTAYLRYNLVSRVFLAMDGMKTKLNQSEYKFIRSATAIISIQYTEGRAIIYYISQECEIFRNTFRYE